jgi:drug/metabolite transporter (DMT)-like permease
MNYTRMQLSLNLVIHTVFFALMFVLGLYMVWHTSTEGHKTAWWSLLLVGVAAGGFAADYRLYKAFREATVPECCSSTNDTEFGQ